MKYKYVNEYQICYDLCKTVSYLLSEKGLLIRDILFMSICKNNIYVLFYWIKLYLFQVLSDKKKRDVYDQYGEEGLSGR